MRSKFVSVFLVFLFTFGFSLLAKNESKPIDKAKEEAPSPFKKYEEVITKEAKTFKGIFTVHQVNEKLYYEIPVAAMGYEYLWVSQLSKAQTGAGYSGDRLSRHVVRWERKGNNVLLRDIQYKLHAKKGSPEAIAVQAASLPAVIGSYKIVCFASDGSPVVDVTDLFTGDVPEFSAKERLNAISCDKNRTFINTVKAFPLNIETRVLATYIPKPPKEEDEGPDFQTISVEIHHSMVKLPEVPMMARFGDKRIGYFDHSIEEYSSPDQQKAETIDVIHRFRLEKQDPKAALSEPVKPIVFYIERGVPEKYKPYIKEGIEAWNEAFEQAGFKNAIMGKYAPTATEDPDWDAEDARYSSIRWMPSTIQNAMGPHIADPRSGETLEADILVYHNVLNLARQWYYVQASPNDPEAQRLPYSDALMGKLLRFVITHEVGHSLGLRHNFKASSLVTTAQARDAKFTAANGYTPSIMDYARFNYLAQPGDGAALIPVIGAYDRFAIEWGYKPFPEAQTPLAEKPFLNEIAARQLTNPLLAFGSGREDGPVTGADHTAQTEDLGDDAIAAGTLGLKNLERVMGYIVAGTAKPGEDYQELKDTYKSVLFQYLMEMGHIANMIGGVEIHNKVHGMTGDIYTPLNKKKQQEAIAFLNKNCFHLPNFLLNKEVIHCLGMHTLVKELGDLQRFVLLNILDSGRAARIGDIEATGYTTYPIYQVIKDLSNGIFSELNTPNQKIGALRRNLQNTFVQALIANLTAKKIDTDLLAASRDKLMNLEKYLLNYITNDDVTHAHLWNLSRQITTAFKNWEK